jgi:dihydropteroate synthase
MMLPHIRRPLIMGILNITPDSFSDGGNYLERDTAVKHALEMVDEGADILDIGGESTRPGSQRVGADQQIERVVPVIKQLAGTLPQDFPISIDSTLAAVADQAIRAGASIINDISAGEDDAAMLPLAAATGVHIILMHKQGTPATMQAHPSYDNVVEQVREYLLARAAAARQAGIHEGNIIIDPGIGFGKAFEHNMEIMENLTRFIDTGYQVLLGTSRKSFLKKLSNIEDNLGLVGATCATTVLGVMAGVRILRVHDVRQNRQAVEVAWALRERLTFNV